MKSLGYLLFATTIGLAAPAYAGEEPIYRAPADWIAVSPLPKNTSGPPIVLIDDQRRLDGGTVTLYSDRAIRIENPQMLSALGTIQAVWLPDKGDLIVHQVSIVRGGETIDLLAQGSRFDVLRREQQLESRTLTGAMTATLAVPGLRVGDVLRVAYSTTMADQALKDEMQTVAPLPAAPLEAGAAHLVLSWPKGDPIKWGATRGFELPEPESRGDYQFLSVKLPLPKAPDLPADAPIRYRMPILLQASTFADWQEVSRVMAPLYETKGAIAPGGPIAKEIDEIRAANSGDLARALAALRAVQDKIAYLANGMAGGNYIPQSPAETWDKRYGDCKAKTLLLLAMLREMGIDAEATLVNATSGDAVATMIPMAAAFDHVLVRATIDGRDYWLDGTDSGAATATLARVPDFASALPIRAAGADLLPMASAAGQGFDNIGRIEFDERAGLDLPTLWRGDWTISGAFAGQMRAILDQANDELREDLLSSFVSGAIGESQVLDSAWSFDPKTNTGKVTASGLVTSPWRWQRGMGKRTLDLPTSSFEFKPDRSRRAWSDIPVKLPGPSAQRRELTVLLPPGSTGYSLEGKQSLSEQIAGARLQRETTLNGDRLTVVDSAVWPGGELPAAEALAERSRASKLGPLALALKAPAGVPRRFALAGKADRSKLAPIEAAYAKLIAKDPDEVENYSNRASFRAGTFDWKGALTDFDKVVELEPSAESFARRAQIYRELGRLDDALADVQSARGLDSSTGISLTEAALLSDLGRSEEALQIVENLDAAGEDGQPIKLALSDLYAAAGRKDDGLGVIEGLLAERPGNPALLNAECWYRGIWQVELDHVVEDCTMAVEQADWSAPVLDSRAMAYFRLGRYKEALADLEAALVASPDLAPTLYMRGIVRSAMGEKDAARDIEAALARAPSLERTYAKYGIARK